MRSNAVLVLFYLFFTGLFFLWESRMLPHEHSWVHMYSAIGKEDLTPIRVDPPSLIPLGVVTGQLLLRPQVAHHISTGTVSTYSLSATAVETIRALDRP